MEERDAFLALYLDGPLQSWGHQSRFDRRTSLSFPTRSGVLGMICAAMGIARGDAAALGEIDGIGMTVLTFRQRGRLMDFHTVGGGFNPKTERQWMVRKANRARPDTVVTRREYLQDSRFGVILRGDPDLLKKMADGLAHPRWGVWLGRKSCIPASPVGQGLFSTEAAALERLKTAAGEDEIRRVVREAATFEEGTDTLMDAPLDFSERRFAPRRIAVELPERGEPDADL